MSLKPKHYGKLELIDNKWIISDIPPHVALRLKQLFPRIPSHQSGTFALFNNEDVAADIVWFTSRYPLLVSSKDSKVLNQASKSFYDGQSTAEEILSPNYTPTERPGLKDGQAFRDIQKVGVDMLEQVRNLIMVDDIGIGKTYEGLGVGLIPGSLPMVVVMEPHLQNQWAEKADEFINLKVHKVKGNKPYSLPKADIYLFKYSQLSPWVDVLTQGWVNAIVFDEIQQLRTGIDSAKGAAAEAICSQVEIRCGLTGTLIYNYGIEAWNIVNIMRPGLLGTRDEFIREWCTTSGNGKPIVKDPDALGAFLQESLMVIRRTRKGQKQMKPHIEWLEPDIDSLKEAEDLAEKLAIKSLSGSFNEAGQATREFDLKMRELTGIAKAKQVAAYVRMFIESGSPVLLFGFHHEVYRIWEEELADLNPLFYTGKQTQNQKDANKKAFIRGESDLLIMSLRSGAGADGLQGRCNTVVKGELDWSPKVHDQGTGRLDRDGQEDDVFVFYAVTNYGSDPIMLDVLGLKESQSRGIQDPGKGKKVINETDPNRIRNMAEQYLKSRGISLPEKPKDNELELVDCAEII